MREIKFRAWEGSRRMDVLSIDFVNLSVVAIGYDIAEGENASGLPLNSLEQFTGLRDKNGKEIYEGDILLGVLATAGRGAVTRKEKPFHFSVVWRAPSLHLSAVDRYSNSTYRWYPGFNECEIVGNIHENPELLEAAK